MGLWAHDPFDPENNEHSSLGDDGVLLLHPHQSYISGLAWIPAGGSVSDLVSCSYDGAILRFDLATERFCVVRAEEGDEFSAMSCQDSNVMLAADPTVRPLSGLPDFAQCMIAVAA